MNLEDLIQYYSNIKSLIELRLSEFLHIWKRANEEFLFAELCFCLCTPQSKAKSAQKAIRTLKQNKILYTGTADQIKIYLSGVRFHNNKSKYIIEARELFKKNNHIEVRSKINICNIKATRDWLVNNIKGLGYKEASHFLRNIGFGKDVTIQDRHILKNLKLLGVIDSIPKTLSPKKYFEIEDKMFEFSRNSNIPIDHLDFVLWHKEAGEVFK